MTLPKWHQPKTNICLIKIYFVFLFLLLYVFVNSVVLESLKKISRIQISKPTFFTISTVYSYPPVIIFTVRKKLLGL